MRLFIAFFSIAFSLAAYPDFCWPSQRLPDARVGEAYEYVVTIKGLAGPLNFDWSKRGKPSWVQFAGPIISGTPSEPHEQPYTLRLLVTDAFGKSTSVEYQLSVRPKTRPLSITTEFVPVFQKGQDSRYEVTAIGGDGQHRWTECTPISLPGGLVLDSGENNQYCVVKGCAKETGKIHLKVTVSDGNRNTQSKELYGQVVELAPPPKPVVSLKIEPFIPPASLNVPYSAQLIAVGGSPPYTWGIDVRESSDLSWIVLDKKTGILSGTPDKITKEKFSVELKDGSGQTISREMRLAINPIPLRLVTQSLPSAIQNVPYSAQLIAIGGHPPYTWDLKIKKSGDLSWIVLDKKTGILSGTPDKITKEKFTVKFKDCTGQTVATDMWLVVKPMPLKLITESLSSATQNIPYSAQLIAVGGTPPYTWDLKVEKSGDLSWIVLDKKTGILSGTPDKITREKFSVELKDGTGQTVSKDIQLAVRPMPLKLITESLPSAIQGVPYSAQLIVVGGTPPYTWNIDVSEMKHPGWISIDPKTGLLSGTSVTHGDFTISFRAKDAEGQTAVSQLKLTVEPARKTAEMPAKNGPSDQEKPKIDKPKSTLKKADKEDKIAPRPAPKDAAKKSNEPPKEIERFKAVIIKLEPKTENAHHQRQLIAEKERKERERRQEQRIAELIAQGETALRLQQFEEARQAFREVLAIDHTNKLAKESLDRIRHEEDRLKKEKEISHLFALGNVSLKVPNYKQARKIFTDVLQLDSTNTEAHEKLEFIKKKEQQQQAEETKKAKFRRLLATAKEKLRSREYAEAIKLTKKALQLSPNSREIIRDGRFIAYTDGTVLDTKTKLMWAAKDSGEMYSYHSYSKSYCEGYRGGGYTDWRMPTIDELRTLYDKQLFNSHGYCITKLIDVGCDYIWADHNKWGGEGAFNFRLGSMANPPDTLARGGNKYGYEARALPVRFCE